MGAELRFRPAIPAEREALGLLKLRSSLAWGDFVDELSALPEARELRSELLAHTVVAEADNRAIGFVTVVPGANGEAELEELFVEPDWWRRGVGRRLVEHAVAAAQADGAISLQVVGNRQARDFYEALGFRFVADVATQFEPAQSMRRPLA